MTRLLVLVNGLPGSGKTTLGGTLARTLNARFLSKDVIKEALASCLENPTGIAELGGIAMDAVWALAKASPVDVVIDSWWFKLRDLSFARAGIERTGARQVVEIWCEVPSQVARARYGSRSRAALYRDEQHLAEDWAEWAAHAAPLGLAPVLTVDTTQSVDCVVLAERVRGVAGPVGDGRC